MSCRETQTTRYKRKRLLNVGKETVSCRETQTTRYKLQSGFGQFLTMCCRNPLAGFWGRFFRFSPEKKYIFFKKNSQAKIFSIFSQEFFFYKNCKISCNFFYLAIFCFYYRVVETRCGGRFVMVQWFIERTLAGWVADLIYVCLETRWLGQNPWFRSPGTTLYGAELVQLLRHK